MGVIVSLLVKFHLGRRGLKMRYPNTIMMRGCGVIFLVSISLVSLAQDVARQTNLQNDSYWANRCYLAVCRVEGHLRCTDNRRAMGGSFGFRLVA